MKLSSILNLVNFTVLANGATLQASIEPLKIAVSVTLGSRSHVKYLFEIMEHLIDRGHHIAYLCTEENMKYSKGYNVNHTIVSNVKMDLSAMELRPFTKQSRKLFPSKSIKNKVSEVYAQSFPIYEKFYKEQKPDLIICDFASSSCIDSAAKFSIPMIIGYQSLGFADRKPYLTTSNGLEPTTIEDYSFWERFSHGVIQPINNIINFYDIFSVLKQIRKDHGVPAKLALTQFTNMGLGIANSYIGFENPRSLPSHVYPIGPILPDTLPTLSADLESFFDSHQKILYIAFGSLIRFKKDLSTNMLEHFQKLLNDGWIDGIVWGGMVNTNLEEFPESYTVDNIIYSTDSILAGTNQQFKLLKWAPQEAVLSHPHTKLFMTHGGLDSIYESVRSRTPMLVVPHIGDQPRNAILIKEHGIGDYIEWPLDGDALINQKFVNLLNPSNSKLKAKLEQHQKIIKFSSNRKLFAADLIETYATSAKICRISEAPKSFEIPCEVKPFLPLDQQISSIKANLIDVYLVAIISLLAIFGLITLVTIRSLSKLYTAYNKQKKD